MLDLALQWLILVFCLLKEAKALRLLKLVLQLKRAILSIQLFDWLARLRYYTQLRLTQK